MNVATAVIEAAPRCGTTPGPRSCAVATSLWLWVGLHSSAVCSDGSVGAGGCRCRTAADTAAECCRMSAALVEGGAAVAGRCSPTASVTTGTPFAGGDAAVAGGTAADCGGAGASASAQARTGAATSAVANAAPPEWRQRQYSATAAANWRSNRCRTESAADGGWCKSLIAGDCGSDVAVAVAAAVAVGCVGDAAAVAVAGR